MINICIIEDDKIDITTIEDHLRNCISYIKRTHKRELSITTLYTREHIPSEIHTILIAKDIDIIFLDFELFWKDGSFFSGLEVLEEILKHKNSLRLPFVFFTSQYFKSESRYAGEFVARDYTTIFNSEIIPKDHFTKTRKIEQNSKHLLKAANLIPKLSLDIYPYPLADPEAYDSEGYLSYKQLKKQEKYFSTKRVFRQEVFVLIIIGVHSKKLLLISLNSEGFVDFNCIVEDSIKGSGNLSKKLETHNIDLEKESKFLFNPDYVEVSNDGNECFLKAGPLLTGEAVGEIIKTIERDITAIIEYADKRLPESVNPFYDSLIKIK